MIRKMVRCSRLQGSKSFGLKFAKKPRDEASML